MLIQTNGPLRSLLALMLPCLAKSRKDEKDERVISLGLHIIRNLLSVKDAVASSTTIGQKEEMSRMQVSSLVKNEGGRADVIVQLNIPATSTYLFPAVLDACFIGGEDGYEPV